MLQKRPDDRIPSDEPGSRWQRLFLAAEHVASRVGWGLTRWYAGLEQASHGLPRYLIRAWTDFNQRDTRYAASLAYYAIFSIFPLILLTVTLLSGLMGPAAARDQILRLVSSFFPGDTLKLIEDNVALALQQRESFGLIAVVGLAWSALSLFSNLTVALDNIFHPSSWRPMWHKRLLALLMTLSLGLLLLVSLLTSIILRMIGILLLDRPSTALAITTLFLPLGLNVAMFALLYRFIPRVHVRWDAIWPAAVFGGIGWDLAQRLFGWYLNNFSTFSLIYGSLGTVIVLLIWVYLSSAILLLGAEFCAALNEWMTDREAADESSEPPEPPPPPPII